MGQPNPMARVIKIFARQKNASKSVGKAKYVWFCGEREQITEGVSI